MRTSIRLGVLAIAAGALVGCGGAQIGSKEEAAKLTGVAGNKGSAGGGVMKLFQSAADANGAFTASCTHGGTVSAALVLSGGQNAGLGALELTYDGCVEPVYDDPSTEAVEREDVVFDGKLTVTMSFNVGGGSAGFTIAMKGRVDLGGAYSDYLEMDVEQTFGVVGSETGVAFSFTIDGTVSTSSESYTYDQESYSFMAEGSIRRNEPGA